MRYLIGLVRDNGWPCAVSKELGKFRGPGRKGDPCPYATLVVLKMLLQFEKWRESKEVYMGAECLLDLWSRSREVHPYIFFMGTDFRKLKAPFVWYDLLHVLDTLSQFGWLKNDSRLQEMVQLVELKANIEGRYTAESELESMEGLGFWAKKEPSGWLTFLKLRIFKRLE